MRKLFIILILASSLWVLSGCKRYNYNRILEEVYDKDQAAREWTYGITSISADEYSLRNTIGLPPIEDYLQTSGQSVGQEIIWDKKLDRL